MACKRLHVYLLFIKEPNSKLSYTSNKATAHCHAGCFACGSQPKTFWSEKDGGARAHDQPTEGSTIQHLQECIEVE